jgi:predicted ATP-grasp superfamily ATP-dependent carboligase
MPNPGERTAMTRGESVREAVLIPTGRELKSYACMRSLNQQGIHTVVASECDCIPQFSSRYCSETATLASPTADIEAYRDSLLDLAARPDIEAVIPIREYDAYVLSKYRDAFTDHVSLVTPSMETLRTGHDRLRLAEAGREAGVPVADTRRLSEVDDWDRDAVVKSRYNILTPDYVDGCSTTDVREVRRITYLQPGDDPDTAAVRASMGHDPVVQDFIPKEDKHLFCALYDHGDPVATYQHRQLRGNSWVGGGAVYRESAYSQEVEDVARQLLSHIDWHGLACLEYVKDAETGEWKFYEINPRMWQSLPSTVRAGADFPANYWHLALGQHDRIDPSYETGVRCHILYGEASHLLSVLREEAPLVERPGFQERLWEIASSCIRHPRFDYLRSDDLPFFASCLRHTLSTGITPSRTIENEPSR